MIRDVNKLSCCLQRRMPKRKGAYQYEGLGWHQNQSTFVIPMAAGSKNAQWNRLFCEFIEKHFKKGNTLISCYAQRLTVVLDLC